MGEGRGKKSPIFDLSSLWMSPMQNNYFFVKGSTIYFHIPKNND